MVLDIINSKKESYKNFITQKDQYTEIHKWNSLKQFQENWDLNAENFGEMYDKCFSDNNELWSSDDFSPKQAMLVFIKLDVKMVKQMFYDLFDEQLDLDIRIDRFAYNCDSLRDRVRETDPTFLKHYHNDFRMISIYLSFKYPTKYCIYSFEEFKEFMIDVKAKTIPTAKDISRFFKVMKTIYTIISKDEDLLKKHKSIRVKNKSFTDESLLLAQDLCYCSAKFDLN